MINWDRINELTEEVGEDDLSEVLLLFCEEVEEVLEKLPSASANEVPAHLHFLKGSAMNIGLESVSQLCKSEEQRITADPSAQPAVEAIQSAYLSAKGCLQPLL